MGNTDEPPVVKADPKDWFKKPKRPPTPDPEWNECKTVHSKPTQKWLSDLAKVEKPSKTFDNLMSTPIDFSTFAMNRLQISDLTQDILNRLFNLKDLQLGVESYQKMLNISRPLMYKVGITGLEPYTTYSNPQGVIYLDKLERNRLMCSHELYKFSDGTLISIKDKLKDMLNKLEMGHTSVMPKMIWSNLDKKWSLIMVKDIYRQLLERRLMRSLENFVGGREYGEDRRLL
uniref:Uncharacterized protein n=1 Tax=Tanacetum cinerariifolium TaxID=118510 RepID=A0A6L2KI12_TANCI|nr:hypothetical protein [Tanacetum cinerariifolium]